MTPFPRRFPSRVGAGLLCTFLLTPSGLLAQSQRGEKREAAPAGSGVENKATALLQSARELASQNRFAEADLLLQQAYRLAPDDIEVLRTYGKVEARLGRLTQAVEALQHAAQLAPNRADVKLELAIAYADEARPAEALSILTEAESMDPRSVSIALNRARVLDDLHRTAEAEKEFAKANRLQPDNALCLYSWSRLKREEGHLAEESALLDELHRVQPGDSDILTRLGRSLSEQGEAQRAIQVLEQAYTLDPSASEAAYLLARLLRKSDPAESRRWMARFDGIRQRQASLDKTKTLGNQAVEASQRRDWPGAIRLYREALAACRSCSVAAGLHKDLGLALCQNGEIPEGLLELQEAYSLDPNDPDTLKALDLLHAR